MLSVSKENSSTVHVVTSSLGGKREHAGPLPKRGALSCGVTLGTEIVPGPSIDLHLGVVSLMPKHMKHAPDDR